MNTRAIDLLKKMIAIPSTSRDEEGTATLIESYLRDNGVDAHRVYNNVWAMAGEYDHTLPTLMLNSHHDTVKPSPAYTRNPYSAEIEGRRLYGLGSNDAGASVVSLIETFLSLIDEPLPFNLLLAITAEEEVGGEKGMRALLPALAAEEIKVDMAIVGEPTGMQPAIGERGLLVMDGVAHGVSGHAARGEGVNALYKAIDDINRLREHQFIPVSEVLGDISVNVTMIDAGRQHNVIPDECRYVVDVRTTDVLSNEETAAVLKRVVKESTLQERSTRVRASVIDREHPLVRAAVGLGLIPFVSPTTSDMSLLHDIPSMKIGPGDSARSHTADEYVLLDEISDAVEIYKKIVNTCWLN